MSWLAAVILTGGLVGAPASPAAAGPIYQPRCYDTLCLGGYASSSYQLAWSRYDVGPTPYYITIFDTRSGELMAICGSGTSCQAPIFGNLTLETSGCLTFVAYIGGWSATMPPAPVIQTSAIYQWCTPGG